jgi:LL-diaminopimelate aminotransferase
VEALRGSQEYITDHNVILQRRRDKLLRVLNEIGLKARVPKATFYIWAKILQGYTSIDFTKKLLEEAAIAVTPGTGYGKEGEGYIRLSLTISDERLEQGTDRLLAWHRRKG